MPYKDLHEEPFDESTIAKLEIFEDYTQAWLPTFIMQGIPTLYIFDFFAGTGYDKNGVAGSPIRILQKVKEQMTPIFQNKVKVIVCFNEFEPGKREQKKFQLLNEACMEYLGANKDLKHAVEMKFFNEDFEVLFPKLISTIKKFPSLVFLDQNGIKFLSDKYLLELEKTTQTDFLYFVSASYFWRFGNSKEFKDHLDIDMATAKKDPYKFIHRNIIGQLRKKLPVSTKVRLYPFSLKKGANIHGIIFGASHVRAVEKFLAIAWKRNDKNGEANFDIDDDAKKVQPDLWGIKKLNKIEKFKENLRAKVLAGEIKNNFDAFNYTMMEGHISSHAADCLKEMKKNKEIDFEGTYPLVTYDNVYKRKMKIEYKILKK